MSFTCLCSLSQAQPRKVLLHCCWVLVGCPSNTVLTKELLLLLIRPPW